MRRVIVLVVICVAQLTLIVGIASASTSGFADGFSVFQNARWSKGDHQLGRSYLDPKNVFVRRGNLFLKTPAHTLDGGELYSNNLYRYGDYSARMRVPYAPTSITGFFLYTSPDFQSELDVEIFNDHSRRISFTTYSGGSMTHTDTMRLPFDASAGYHRYFFRYAPHSLSFYVDGKLTKRWTRGLTRDPMRLIANTWYPNWLGGQKPGTNRFVRIDWIRFSPR